MGAGKTPRRRTRRTVLRDTSSRAPSGHAPADAAAAESPHLDALFAIFHDAGVAPHEVVDATLQHRYSEWIASPTSPGLVRTRSPPRRTM